MSQQRQRVLLSNFKTLSVGPAGFEPVTSRSADRGLSNTANQVAVTYRLVNIKLGFDRLIV